MKFLFTISMLALFSVNNIMPDTILQVEHHYNINQNKKQFHLNLIKLHYAKTYGDNFIKFVFDEGKEEKDCQIIQRYFKTLANYLVKAKIKKCLITLENYINGTTKNLERNVNTILGEQLNDNVIKETEKEIFGEDVYFIINGKKWETPEIILPGFDSNDLDQVRHKHWFAPSRKDITVVHETITKIVDKLKINSPKF